MKEQNFDPLKIKTDIFEGPLDLLLHLIRKKKLDIQTVVLAELCQPFLKYVKNLKKLQLDNLGQFLYIASSLIVIKTRILLPKITAENEEQDTEEDLRKQLIEYDRIKKTSSLLASMPWLFQDIFPRAKILDSQTILDVENTEQNIEINIPDLFESYKTILMQLKNTKPDFDLPSFKINSQNIFEKILENFQNKIFFDLKALFSLFYNLQEKIIAFILVLEVCRFHWIRIEQKKFLGEILFFPNQNFINDNKNDIRFS